MNEHAPTPTPPPREAVGLAPVVAWLAVTLIGGPLGVILGLFVIAAPVYVVTLFLLSMYANARGIPAGLGMVDAAQLISFPLGIIIGIGVVVGLGQWLVLRKKMPRAAWWIVATTLGMPLGAVAGLMAGRALSAALGSRALAAALAYAVAGGIVGLTQWLVLRRRVRRAGWWVAGSGAAFGLGILAGLGMRSLIGAPVFEPDMPPDMRGILLEWGTLRLGPPGYVALAGAVGLVTVATMNWLLGGRVWRAIGPGLLLLLVVLLAATGYSRIDPGTESIQRSKSVQVRVLEGHPERVFEVAWSPDGSRLASSDFNGHIYVWDAATGRVVTDLADSPWPVTALQWSPTGDRLASENAIWFPHLAQRVAIPRQYRDALLWSPDGRLLVATGYPDHSARILDGTTGVELAILRGHRAKIDSASWAPDGKRIASASEDGTIRVWDISGRELAVMTSLDVAEIAWSPDGLLLAATPVGAGERELDIRIWDVSAAREERRLRMLAGIPRPLPAWSHDGEYLAAPGGLGLYVWETSGWTQYAVVPYPVTIQWMAWSPRAPIMAVITGNTIRLWDAVTRRETLVLRGHPGDILSVAWSPDGKQVASGGGEGTIRVWTLP